MSVRTASGRPPQTSASIAPLVGSSVTQRQTAGTTSSSRSSGKAARMNDLRSRKVPSCSSARSWLALEPTGCADGSDDSRMMHSIAMRSSDFRFLKHRTPVIFTA